MRLIPSNIEKFQTFSSQSANFPHKIAKKFFFLNFPLIPLHFFYIIFFLTLQFEKNFLVKSCRIKKTLYNDLVLCFWTRHLCFIFFSSSLRRKVRENFFSHIRSSAITFRCERRSECEIFCCVDFFFLFSFLLMRQKENCKFKKKLNLLRERRKCNEMRQGKENSEEKVNRLCKYRKIVTMFCWFWSYFGDPKDKEGLFRI